MADNQVAVIQKDITDRVNTKLSELQNDGLVLPKDYAHSNALKSAFFALQEVKSKDKKPALDVCTPDSIANALLNMVTQGLSPAKTQCYFIVYGNQLQLNRSYFGTQAVLKRLSGVKDIWANVIYKDDEFVIAIEKGREVLVSHSTAFENRDGDIKGAYAIIEREDGEQVLTTMTKKEIDKAWSKTKTGGYVQKDFGQEMAKRTVINRAAKAFINTSDDSDLLIQAINDTTENEYDNERKDVSPIEEVSQEIEENANQTTIDFDDNAEIIDVETMAEPTETKQEELFDAKRPPIKQAEPNGPAY